MAQTPNSQTQTSQINKKLIFSATKSHINCSSRLTIEVTVKDGYFSKLQVKYDEGENFIAGYFSKSFSVVTYTDHRYVSYKENSANANIPESQATEFKYELKTTGEEDPYFWEDEYLSSQYEEKWKKGTITIDEAKKMIEDAIDYYEPEDYDNPADSFIKVLFGFVKSVLDNNEYKFEVEIQELKE